MEKIPNWFKPEIQEVDFKFKSDVSKFKHLINYKKPNNYKNVNDMVKEAYDVLNKRNLDSNYLRYTDNRIFENTVRSWTKDVQNELQELDFLIENINKLSAEKQWKDWYNTNVYKKVYETSGD